MEKTTSNPVIEVFDTSPHIADSSKMFTYLKGFFDGARMEQSKSALIFAREVHGNQHRDSGELYISHPLTMACHATSMGIRDDRINATMLLHDVVENCHVSLDSLPVSSDVKRSVSLVTFERRSDIDKETCKRLYYEGIKKDYAASICKLFDRCNNVSTMVGTFSIERLVKYIKETEEYIYPLLRHVKETYPDYSNAVYVLRYHIDSVVAACKIFAKYAKENPETKTSET